jgi:hypothetical protein
MSELERASEEHELAEAAFIDAVRATADRGTSAVAAHAVADAASRFNELAHRAYRSGRTGAWMPLDHLTERTRRSRDSGSTRPRTTRADCPNLEDGGGPGGRYVNGTRSVPGIGASHCGWPAVVRRAHSSCGSRS